KYIKIKNRKFLVHVKPLGLLFKRLFKQELKKTAFYAQIDECVWKKDWVVHAEPAGYGQEIIKYVAPYVYRILFNLNAIG
ncbi:MAG: transposase, partial [Candidatus Firestonebacteria bacterium]|nr:transposase [Candidatus Firestonebacteria bacterium]